jgi:hypothetical protein
LEDLLWDVAGAAYGAEPTQQDLLDKINSLQAQVDALKSQSVNQNAATTAPTQASDEQISAATQQVLAQSDKSSGMDMGDWTAGYDAASRRFVIRDSDGNFTLRPWIHIQVRNSTAYRTDGQTQDGKLESDTENGFEIRRARLGFDGNLFTPNLTYFINWATLRENQNLTVKNGSSTVGTASVNVGGAPILEEAWIKYNFDGTPWYVHAGQMHDPLDHEAIIGSKYRAPEDSLQGDIFANTDTFTQAATLIYDSKQSLRTEGGITDGIRAANTNFQDAPTTGIDYDWGAAGRVEYKVMGNWSDYNQLTALNDKDDLLVFGAGADYSEGKVPTYFNQLSHTLDVQYGSPSGLFLYGAYFGRYTDHNPGIVSGGPTSTSIGSPGIAGQDTYEYSGLLQAAYLVPNTNMEPYVRGEYMSLKGLPAHSQGFISEISAGMNWYFYGHNVKWTNQVMYLPDGIPVNDDTNDVLISNDHTEAVFISQIQLLL